MFRKLKEFIKRHKKATIAAVAGTVVASMILAASYIDSLVLTTGPLMYWNTNSDSCIYWDQDASGAGDGLDPKMCFTSDGLILYTGFSGSSLVFTVDGSGTAEDYEIEITQGNITTTGTLAGTTANFTNFTGTTGTVNSLTNNTSANFTGSTITGLEVETDWFFDFYEDENQRFIDERVRGNLVQLASGQPINNSPTNITVNPGQGKLVMVLNTCADAAGSVTVTGDTADRDDSDSVTSSDTDTLSIESASTDNTATDDKGNSVWDMDDVYMTSKWFTGASVVFSTSDISCTDVDIYQIAFEQVNDREDLTLETLDFTADITNTAGWVRAYVYTITDDGAASGDRFNINNPLNLTLEPANANVPYRGRNSTPTTIDGSKEGFWGELHLGGSPSTYFNNINFAIEGKRTVPVT